MEMSSPKGKHCVCSDQQTVRAVRHTWRHRWLRLIFPLAGLLALIWFLVRVIPKASRASYPCQRVAFPLASSFIIWLAGTISTAVVFRKARHYFLRSRYVIGIICVVAGIVTSFVAIRGGSRDTAAGSNIPNDPVGVAQGVNPGRVVWVHDANATDWDGPNAGDGHWWEDANTKSSLVAQMLSHSLHALTGESNSVDAWDALFRHFNQTHGRGDVGYQAGEKITIKVNFVGFIWYGTAVNKDTYDLVRSLDYMNTSPQMMLALLRQLVNVVGVHEADISIGDTVSYFPNQYYNMVHAEFPDVNYLDYEGKFGRTAIQSSTVPVYWSKHPSGVSQDYVPLAYAEADYIINMANLKSHTGGGVTLCGKNHYGSLKRWPGQAGYYNLHQDLPSAISGWGHYRNLVDLMGHEHIGGKTLLYCIDGLYAGEHPTDVIPTRMVMPPFDGDWSSSLLVSQDPVAIDSVGFDILFTEANSPGTAWSSVANNIAGGDDYLHEAAQADNPSSNTFYDPNHEGDVTRLASRGVHEHWNNPADRLYTRNLGAGDGIELMYINEDIDHDSISNNEDNCSGFPNGAILGTCVTTAGEMIMSYQAGDPRDYIACTSDADCLSSGGICQMEQGDCNGNGTGDACECYADCDCNSKVDLADLVLMKGEFLQTPVYADCNGDNQVNLSDLVIMKSQFFRTGCPACP